MKKILCALVLLGMNAGLLGKVNKATLMINNPKTKAIIFEDKSSAKTKTITKQIPVGTDYTLKVGTYKKKPYTINLHAGKPQYTVTIKKGKVISDNTSAVTVK